MRYELTCPQCGKDFVGYQSWRICCSKACSLIYPTFERRFWEKVAVGEENECWLWIACQDEQGYGVIGGREKSERQMTAHRASYIIHHGSIPEGLDVLHSCDCPPCVNPKHLTAGTPLQNMRDKVARGRHRCPYGEAHYATKFSDVQIDQIRKRYATGDFHQDQLADTYGTTQQVISKIVNFKVRRRVFVEEPFPTAAEQLALA